MLKRLFILLAVALSGCAQLEPMVGQLPSLRYCSEVVYHRSHQAVTLAASCTVPFGM